MGTSWTHTSWVDLGHTWVESGSGPRKGSDLAGLPGEGRPGLTHVTVRGSNEAEGTEGGGAKGQEQALQRLSPDLA